MSAEEVAGAIRIGVTLARQLGRRYIETGGAEGIPCAAYGRLLRFPTAGVRRHLGIDQDPVLCPPATPAATAVAGTDHHERGPGVRHAAPGRRIVPIR